MLPPYTVTLAEPVPALLARLVPLIPPPMSVLHASVADADDSPAVIDTRRVPRTSCATWHLADVSDSHSVASHPLCPTREAAV